MTLPASGQISLNDVNVELGYSGTTQVSLNDSAVRTLFEIASGEIEMSDGYGKADFSPWTTTPTFQDFRGGNSTITGTYTPTSGTVKFLVMMWGSVGHGGNTTDYSNLPPIGAASAGGAGYVEKLYTHSGSTTYSYTLGSRADYRATGGGYTPPSRTYAGTTNFNGDIYSTGTGNPGSTGGSATGGDFNAPGGTANSNSTGAGSGSRTGNGQANGSNGGTSVSGSAVNIDFMGWRGFDWSSSWGESGSRGSNGRGKYHPRSGDPYDGAALTAMEEDWADANKYERAGAPKYNVSNSTTGPEAQILILEYHSGDSDGT